MGQIPKQYMITGRVLKISQRVTEAGEERAEFGRNVWLGLDVVLIGHRTGADSFVMPKSIVKTDIGKNTVGQLNPCCPVELALPGKGTHDCVHRTASY